MDSGNETWDRRGGDISTTRCFPHSEYQLPTYLITTSCNVSRSIMTIVATSGVYIGFLVNRPPSPRIFTEDGIQQLYSLPYLSTGITASHLASSWSGARAEIFPLLKK